MAAGNGVTSSRSRRGGHLTESVPTTYGWESKMPEEAKARGNAPDRLTSGRGSER